METKATQTTEIVKYCANIFIHTSLLSCKTCVGTKNDKKIILLRLY